MILDGPFEGIAGRVKDIDERKQSLGIVVEMFGRTQEVWVEWSVGMRVL